MQTPLALPQNSAAARFRGGFTPMVQAGGAMVRATTNGLQQVVSTPPSNSNAITRPRAGSPSLVPSRQKQADTVGAIISGEAGGAATLFAARIADRSKLGLVVKEFTGGARLSDVAGAAAILGRMTGFDAGFAAVRANGTRLIKAKLYDWVGRAGDMAGDAMEDWEKLQTSKVEKTKAKDRAEVAQVVEVKAKPAQTPVEVQAAV